MHKKSVFLIVVGLIIFSLLFHYIGSSEVLVVLLNIDPVLLTSAILLQFLMMFSWNLKWKFLFDHLKIKISYFKLFPILLAGNFGDAISPGARVGGEPLRLYYLTKKKVKMRNALTTILLERVYNLIAFIGLAIVSIALVLLTLEMPLWMTFVMLFSLLVVLGLTSLLFYSFYNEKKGLRLVGKIVHKIAPKLYKIKVFKLQGKYPSPAKFESDIKRSIKHFFDEVIQTAKSKGLLAYGIFLSLLYFFQIFIQAYIIFWAVGAQIPFYLVLSFIIITDLVGLLLLIPSGVGVVELMLVIFARAAGIPAAPAVAAVLVIRGIYYIFSIGAGYLSMIWLERK